MATVYCPHGVSPPWRVYSKRFGCTVCCFFVDRKPEEFSKISVYIWTRPKNPIKIKYYQEKRGVNINSLFKKTANDSAVWTAKPGCRTEKSAACLPCILMDRGRVEASVM